MISAKDLYVFNKLFLERVIESLLIIRMILLHIFFHLFRLKSNLESKTSYIALVFINLISTYCFVLLRQIVL